MAITSTGYDGVVTEGSWAKLATTLGAEYGVIGDADWRVTIKPAADRTVQIAVGSGYGHGIYDTLDSVVELQHAIVASGSRWDMVVMNRDWSGASGTSAFEIIQGGTSLTLPTRPNSPGTEDAQPIAMVQITAGQTLPTATLDLRVWQANGGCYGDTTAVLQYLTRPGTTVTIATDTWNRCVISGVATWLRDIKRQTRCWWFARISGIAEDRWAAPQGWVGLVAGTIPNANAGWYEARAQVSIKYVGSINGSGSSGWQRFSANGNSADCRADVGGISNVMGMGHTFYHAGGTLTITYSHLVSIGMAGIDNAGSGFHVNYLGP